MPGKLRIFISSTMDDLENERATIKKRLESLNFDPVNAEGILPNGATSWERISEELETCHVMVLLSGNRYGWVPSSGPLTNENISVTHGEYRAARALGLPVLPFFKRLAYNADRTSEDAKGRDAFRKEIEDWDKGQFRSVFTNVVDLADSVGEAIVRMLSDDFQRSLIQKRRMQTVDQPPRPAPPPRETEPIRLHGWNTVIAKFVRSVTQGRAILWAGSGISLGAGLPSAGLLSAELVRSIQEKAAGYEPPAVGSGIASVTSDFELMHSRELLLEKLRDLLDLPGGVAPADAHFQAVELFPRIITTNYDKLLEAAAETKKTGHVLIFGPEFPSPAPQKFIWKIHGAADHPDVLVMSESDLARFEAATDILQPTLRKLFESGPVLVAGTSLRDRSVLRLFRALRPVLDGYWTVMPGDVLGQARAKDLRLQPVEGTVESVLAALTRARGGPGPRFRPRSGSRLEAHLHYGKDSDKVTFAGEGIEKADGLIAPPRRRRPRERE
jgi:hypothetical protein